MILAIDSSSMVASVAIVGKDTIISEYTVNMKKTHSQTLLPMIDEIVRMTGIEKKEIKAIAVTKGPGSFTGLRIGAATAKGLALALNIGVISVSTIESMAYSYNHCNKLICPIMDARRNQVYTGIYECIGDEISNIMPDCAISIEELINRLEQIGKEVIFVGDGIPVFKEIIDEKLKITHYYGKQHMNRQKAGAVGALAWEKYEAGQAMNGDDFSPEYMRMSQAERERMENDKKND